MKKTNLNIIEVQRETIIKDVMASFQEALLGHDFDTFNANVEMLRSTESGELLRKAFRDGYTFCLVPNEMDKIEKFDQNKEYFIILVRDGDKTFTVVPEEDVYY